MIFNVSETIVCEVINLSWLSTAQWGLMMGNLGQIPHAVGAIDGTSHKIEIPTIIPQLLFSSSER